MCETNNVSRNNTASYNRDKYTFTSVSPFNDGVDDDKMAAGDSAVDKNGHELNGPTATRSLICLASITPIFFSLRRLSASSLS